jgi:hypothetical protein
MPCPHCHDGKLIFDLAADELIYLSFWTCSGCGRRGILRMIDRAKGQPPATAHRLAESSGARSRLLRPAHPARTDRVQRPLRHESA